MNALQLQNLATLAAAAAAAQTSATTTNANPLSTTSSALGALTSPGKRPGEAGCPGLHAGPGGVTGSVFCRREPEAERACVVSSEEKAGTSAEPAAFPHVRFVSQTSRPSSPVKPSPP